MGGIERWECPNDADHGLQPTAAPRGVQRWRCFGCGVDAVEVDYVPASQLRGAVEGLYGAARSLEIAASRIVDHKDHRKTLEAAERARIIAGGLS